MILLLKTSMCICTLSKNKKNNNSYPRRDGCFHLHRLTQFLHLYYKELNMHCNHLCYRVELYLPTGKNNFMCLLIERVSYIHY